ncbi:hypothetical protein TI04_04335 [Achromatium sp. WMS2]|nr:hypothetical protein TI04_04335 [Achromatium sp. WMS2]
MLAADKGYHSKDLRKRLRKRGTRPKIPKRVWNDKKPPGRPLKNDTPRFQAERGRLPVTKEIPQIGGTLGTYICLFQCVSYLGYHLYMDRKINSGIDSCFFLLKIQAICYTQTVLVG